MAVQDILNFIQIDNATASGGQPSERQLREVQKAGYDLVINLAPDGLATSLPDEDRLLASLNIAYLHIPVPWDNPGLEQLDDFIAAMDGSVDRRKLIHCQANYRVTAFYALYAMARLGWDRQRADAFMDQVWTSRPGFAMDNSWKRFIDAASQRAGAGP